MRSFYRILSMGFLGGLLAISFTFLACDGTGQGVLPINGLGGQEDGGEGPEDEGDVDEGMGPTVGITAPGNAPGGQDPSVTGEPVDIPVTIAKALEILNPLLIDIAIDTTVAGEMVVPLGMPNAIPSPSFQSFLQILNLANGMEKRAKVELDGSFALPMDPEEENLAIPLISRDDVIAFTPYKGEEAQVSVLLSFDGNECVWSWDGGELDRNDCRARFIVVAEERPPVEQPLPPEQIQPLQPGGELLPDSLLLNDLLDPNMGVGIPGLGIPGLGL